ncbi:MAG: MotA/TolQ/ExbB proton channel family protein [Gammaproteobacteria bacterium]|nr:MotA/TolQ/ExbB proton channel family protein [Gammaproteobacteria bacterium]
MTNNPQTVESDETLADLAAANLTGKSKDKYPTEQSFSLALSLSALLVLLPSILLVQYPVTSLAHSHLYLALWGNWISPFILWFFVAGTFHLLLKKRKLKVEMAATHLLSSQVIPAVLSESAADLPSLELFRRFREQLMQIAPKANAWNLLLSRCRLLLAHNPDTRYDMGEMPHDDEAGLFDREYMRSSFALPRFMVWAIPILGFIGTVWGISQGIANFSGTMSGVDAASDISATLKDSLPLVTENLATAFDTTFIALVLSIPLMLMLTWIEKAEENYLITLDELWLYEIKPELSLRLPKTAIPAAPAAGTAAAANHEEGSVAAEISLLSAQVGALQETMQDLYESVFASSLARRGDQE